jgi:hypothetical protein
MKEKFEVGDTVGWIRQKDGAHFEGTIVTLMGDYVRVKLVTIDRFMVPSVSEIFLVEKAKQ